MFLFPAVAGCAASSSPPPVQHGSASLYLPGHTEPQLVHFAVQGGEAVMGGDIRLGPVDSLEQTYAADPHAGLTGVHGAVTIDGASRLWPGGVMPYEIDPTVNAGLRREIEAAAAELNSRTRLKIRPRTPLDSDYMVFNVQNPGGTCDSVLGRKGGAQAVRINGCAKITIMHEILHAAGFDHEHQRSDRDAFVTIVWENVDPAHRVWLERIDDNRTTHTPYDHQSIMHYQSTAFSRNGGPTIVSRIPGVNVQGVQKLSSLDIQAIDRVYAGGPSDSGGGVLPILGGLGLPLPGLPQNTGGNTSSLPFPGAVSLPLPSGVSLPPQLGGIQDAAGALQLPWPAQ